MPQRRLKLSNPDNLNVETACYYPDPSICPICDHAIVPQALSGFYVLDENTASASTKIYSVYICFFCPNCREVFTIRYKGYLPSGAPTIDCRSISGIFPRTAKATIFSEAIADISPQFIKIYNQAETAEANNLDEIVGAGYRRALEFLVKDYLCRKKPDEAEAIKSELLSASLKRIEYDRVQTLATKATWLGNDATHYVWKHEDYDIEDLKRFITAMLRYIELELAFDDALAVPYIK